MCYGGDTDRTNAGRYVFEVIEYEVLWFNDTFCKYNDACYRQNNHCKNVLLSNK